MIHSNRISTVHCSGSGLFFSTVQVLHTGDSMSIRREMVADHAKPVLTLQSKTAYSQLLRLSPLDGTFWQAFRSERDGEAGDKINGVFVMCDGVLAALYAFDGALVLRLGNETIPVVEGIRIKVERKPKSATMVVLREDRPVAALPYVVAEHLRVQDDPTPFVDEEDYDFGLYVKNLLSDVQRRRNAVRNWQLSR